MEIKFDGDLVALTPESEEICRNILQKKGFTNCTAQVETVGKKGDNYVANVKRVIAQQNGVNSGKSFKMVIKLAPIIQQTREMMGTDIAFNNEIIVYEELFPKYDKLQEEANIPVEERLKHPLCYGSSSEPPNEIILLEDIKESNFQLANRFVSMTNEHARLALKDLAKFHALSYVVKIKDPDFFNNIKNKLVNLWVRSKNAKQMEEYLTSSEKDTQNMLRNEEYKNRISGLVENLLKNAISMHEKDFNRKYSAIIQGDCWTNNMMFKIMNNTPLEVIMLDYQLTRIASPAADFFYFVLNCVDYETRQKFFYEWLDFYYQSFKDFLAYFNLEAHEVYPREIFDEDLKTNVKASFGMAVMLSNVLVREPEDVIDFKELKTDISPEDFSVNGMRDVILERYNTRIEGIIKSCIEFGYI